MPTHIETIVFDLGGVLIDWNPDYVFDKLFDSEDRKRYLLRLWLSPPDGIELPQAFAGRYNSVTAGDRGGVTIPGMPTNV